MYFDLQIKIVENSVSPLIDKSHKGSFDNKEGYENGSVIKLPNGQYHMLITELFYVDDEMKQGSWSPARIGHWVSDDGDNWERNGTVVQGNKILQDPKENTWSPSFFWNEEENRWNIFWRGASAVFRYASSIEGKDGINGPYYEIKQIWPPLLGPANWDFGGFASFSNVFTTKNNEYAVFYCSVGEENSHLNWVCGLAFADHFDGPWKRNPYTDEPTFLYCENPFVYVYDGVYYCVYDDLSCQKSIGVGYSVDGVNWKRKLIDFTDAVLWANSDWYVDSLRTPMSLIKEDDGTYSVYFTASEKKDGYFSVGKIKLSISKTPVEQEKPYVDLAEKSNYTAVSGMWSYEHGEISQDDILCDCAKLQFGKTDGDFVIETQLRCVDIKKKEQLVENYFTKECAEYNTQGGIYFGDGENGKQYFLNLTADKQMLLYCEDKLVAASKCTAFPFIFKNLKAVMKNGIINAYLDGENVLMFNCVDYCGGYYGIDVKQSHWHFEKFLAQENI